MSEGWLTPFDGDGIEWHESLPSPYTYQESDFGKLVTAVHQYESRALECREALHRCRKDQHAKVTAVQQRLAESERVRRQLAEALHWIDAAIGIPNPQRDVARAALAASDALDKEAT